MLKYVNCNLCGADDTKTLIAFGASNIVQCKKCGLIYANPRLPGEEVLRKITSDGVIAEHKQSAWLYSKIRLFKRNLKRIEKYSFKGRLLDVGCGYGIFLRMAKDNGWQIEGVELAESACRYARENLGLNIFQGTLKQANFSDNLFDVVTLWEVLGEVADPLTELKEVRRVLKDEGLITLRLHNGNFHVFIERFLRYFGNFCAKLNIRPTIFHLYNFSPKTIRKILEKAGFENIKVFISEHTSGDPYNTGGILGPLGVKIIKKIIFYLCTSIFYVSFGSLILSPSMLILARKPSR